jgi:Uma2 family endonuclease
MTVLERPQLPQTMTWEELERLPEEIAENIELWEGKPVWLRRGPADHQDYTSVFWSALRRNAREEKLRSPEDCWKVTPETNVFFGTVGKDDFVTPDFLVYRCPSKRFQDVRAADVLLVGEVLSPSNTASLVTAKMARYASAGIPFYWDIALSHDETAHPIELVRAFALDTGPARLPHDMRPLYRANYLEVAEWTPQNDPDGISIPFPFPIQIPWEELEP